MIKMGKDQFVYLDYLQIIILLSQFISKTDILKLVKKGWLNSGKRG
jgi:hypothetical protein